MSAIGRISGPLLKSNLLRNGIDLAFETDLLYLDVNNQRIGIKNATPQYELDITGTTRTTDLRVTNRADIANINIVGNTISSDSNTLNIGTLNDVVYNNRLTIDSLRLDGNTISTNESNANLELNPNGTGSVEVLSDMNVTGNIHATGNISADGNIILGDAETDSVTFNANVASNIIPDEDDTYKLGTAGIQYASGTDYTIGDATIVISSGTGTLSVPAAGVAWIDDVTAESTGYYYLITLGTQIGTRYAATTTANWSGTNPQTVTVNIPDAPDGTYDVVQINKEARRWSDIWVKTITTDGINTGTIIVDGINLTVRQGNIYYVSENGDDTNYGDHPQDPFASLSYALSVAAVDVANGDYAPTIHITPGIYTETFPLTVPAGVTVKGENLRSVKIVPTVATQDLDAFLLNGETTIEDITVADFYYDSSNDTGYAFRFATGFEVTSRSPYIKNVTVITKGSTVTAEDPRGFNAGDAGKGALVDGANATANSKEAAMLFHSATFITPGVDGLTATNGARIEWLNSFTYFANRSLYAFDSSEGLKSDGKTRIRLGGISNGPFSAGDTITFTSTDDSTIVNVTAESVEGDVIVVDGKNTDLIGFDTTPASISNGSGTTATIISNLDVRDFGAEIRMIGSASVYGNYGLVGDGEGVLVYAIGHNLAYIGNGKEVTNDPTTVIQANEVVENNGAQIRFNSVDHKGDFRVGDLFYVNQESGNVSFSVSDFVIDTTNGVTVTTGSNTTFIDGNKIETGDWRFSGNTIETLTQDANINSASGTINLQDNTNITGNLDVTGNVTIGGNITIGDEATDTIQIVAGIDSDIIPRHDSAYSLGTAAKTWSNLYANQVNVDDIEIRDNYITTLTSNADLELRANGTGDVLIPNNDVTLEQDLTVNGTTALANTNITGTITLSGDLNQTGNLDIAGEISNGNISIEDNFITTTDTNSDLELRANGTGEVLIPSNDVQINSNLTVDGNTDLQDTVINGAFTLNESLTASGTINVGGNLTVTDNATFGTFAQFEEILIDDNFITTTTSNSNLELRANGTGEILVPNNDVNITNDLAVTGDISANNLTVTANITANDANIGDMQISGTTVEATATNADLELRANGTGIISIPSSDVILGQALTVSGATDLQATTITGLLTHVGDTTQTGNVTLTGNWTNGDIQITSNILQTTASNSTLELRANGTGEILVPNNNVVITQDLTVSGATDLQNTTVTGSITHVGDTTQTGNYTITGQFSNGDVLIDNNTVSTTLSNSNLELRANGSGVISIPTNNVTITNNLGVNGVTNLDNTYITGLLTHVGDTTQTGKLEITGQFSNGDIQIDANTIETTNTNSDLELRANGSGTINVPSNDVTFSQALTVSGATDLQNTTITGTVTHVGDTVQTGNLDIAGEISNGNVLIEDNFIATIESNSDLELRASSTGEILIPNNNVQINNNLTVSGATDLQDTTVTGAITHTGNTTQTGNYTITGQFSNGDIQLDGNTIETTDTNSDLELRAAGSGIISIPSNDVTFSQALTVSGTTNLQDTTITGTVTHTGDYNQTGNFTIGGEITNGNILIEDNFIATTTSNADLELRAAGTGEVLIPDNDVRITNNLFVNGDATLGDTTLTGNVNITGDITQTGDYSITSDLSVGGNLTITRSAQFEEILIDDNFITTTTSNADLELRANGTGDVLIPNNDLHITNDLAVDGTITVGDINSAGTITANSFSTGDILIDDNFITTTTSNSDLELRANGTGEVVVPSNNVTLEQDLTVNGDTDLENTSITGTIIQVGDTTQTGNFNITGNVTVSNNLTVDASVQLEEILIDDNFITTTTSNSDLELRANGTGEVLIPNNNVTISNNLEVNGTLNVANITATGNIEANAFTTGDILIDDNFITTTNSNSDLELRGNGTGSIIIDDLEFKNSSIISSSDITISPGSGKVIINSTGSLVLPVGNTSQRPTEVTGQIRYNNELNRFEGYNGTNWINLVGVEDLDGDTKVTAEATPGANDDTIRFDVAGVTVVDINSDRLNAHKIAVDDIQVDGNVISTTTANTDLVLTANGTGSVKFENFAFSDNVITNTVSDSVTTFEATDNGYVKFDGTYGLVIPVGGNVQRPPLANTETGMMRFNTDASRVEIYDGVNWVSVAGSASGISRADAEDIAFEIVLSLG